MPTVRHPHILKTCLNCAHVQIRTSGHQKKPKFRVLLFCCWDKTNVCLYTNRYVPPNSVLHWIMKTIFTVKFTTDLACSLRWCLYNSSGCSELVIHVSLGIPCVYLSKLTWVFSLFCQVTPRWTSEQFFAFISLFCITEATLWPSLQNQMPKL